MSGREGNPHVTPDAESAVSSRPLGLWSATALVVGSMIGSGVFLLPASLAPYGAASLLGWGVTLCGALLLALTFARMAARWPQTGGPYVYARNVFGELPGMLDGEPSPHHGVVTLVRRGGEWKISNQAFEDRD